MRIKILLMAAAASVAMTGCSYPLKGTKADLTSAVSGIGQPLG
jgi:hypothetical protein